MRVSKLFVYHNKFQEVLDGPLCFRMKYLKYLSICQEFISSIPKLCDSQLFISKEKHLLWHKNKRLQVISADPPERKIKHRNVHVFTIISILT